MKTSNKYLTILSTVLGVSQVEIEHYINMANQFHINFEVAVEDHWEESETVSVSDIRNLLRLRYCFLMGLESKLFSQLGETNEGENPNFDISEEISNSYIFKECSVDFQVRNPKTLVPYESIQEIIDFIFSNRKNQLEVEIQEDFNQTVIKADKRTKELVTKIFNVNPEVETFIMGMGVFVFSDVEGTEIMNDVIDGMDEFMFFLNEWDDTLKITGRYVEAKRNGSSVTFS